MRIVILIMLVAFALGAAAAAAYPIEVSVASDHAWMVADGKDAAIITATVTRGTGEFAGEPLEGANVSFSVGPAWELKDSFLLTDKDGVATTTLKATTKSGTADITVTAWAMIDTETWGYQNYSTAAQLSQPIDHGTPSYITASYNGKVQVQTSTHVAVLLRDKYGNPVDNRKTVEQVRFDASAGDGSGFLSGASWVKSITVPVNESGYVDVQYLVAAEGPNYIGCMPPAPVSPSIISITGVYSGEPTSITESISPDRSPPRQPADGISKFTITYLLSDNLGGGSANRVIHVNTSTGESMNITTNEKGLAQIIYGPATNPGIALINATVLDNPAVNSSVTVEFVIPENDLVLTADPQSMASLDINGKSVSNVKGQVVDNLGNPVPGQTVNFRFISMTNGTTILTQLPNLTYGASTTSALFTEIPVVTDPSGYATLQFYPGAFTTDKSSPGYNAAETGKVIVRATCDQKTKEVNLSYRNYNYVSVVSNVTPDSVPRGGIVNVTITITGDGVTLQPEPVNVVIVMDQSASMLTTDMQGKSRIYWAKQAAKAFVGSLNKATDKVAFLKFGTDPLDPVPLTNNFDAINTSIDNTNPQSTMAYATNLRKAVYLAIKHLTEAGSTDPKTVKAVVVMTDGGWNHDGTPLAKGTGYPDTRDYYSSGWKQYNGGHPGYASADNEYFRDLAGEFQYTSYKYFTAIGGGTITTYPSTNKQPLPTKDGSSAWNCPGYADCVPSSSATKYQTKLCKDGEFSVQNMSIYAKDNNIRLYTIAYANQIPNADMTATHLQALQILADATGGTYSQKTTGTDLVQLYQDIAGSLRDKAGVGITMTADHHEVAVSGVPMANTLDQPIFSYVYDPGNSTTIKSWNSSGTADNPNIVPFHTVDQRADWKDDRNLTFNVGTVTVGQIWVARYQLQMNATGSVAIFNNRSGLTFTDSYGKQSTMEIPDKFVSVLGNPTVSGITMDDVTVQNLRCTAPRITNLLPLQWDLTYTGAGTVSQTLWYAMADTPNIQTQFASYPTALAAGTYPLATNYPVGWSAGHYIITVKASGSKGGYDEKSIPVEVTPVKVMIKIE